MRVFVATTEGPSEVLRITKEDPAVRSVICLDGTMRPLPISRDYEHFVRRPTGVVERLFGHSAFRVDVSHPVTHGESWQLGLLLAHGLHHGNGLSGHGATRAFWVSGAVRQPDLAVRPVDHIAAKLRASAQLFRELAATGCSVSILVASDQLDETRSVLSDLDLPVVPTVTSLTRWQDLKAVRTTKVAPVWRRKLWVALTGAMVLTGIIWLGWAGAKRMAAPSRQLHLSATEIRAPQSMSCGRLRFVPHEAVRVPVSAEIDDLLPSRASEGLCAVEFSVANDGPAQSLIWLATFAPEDMPQVFDPYSLEPGQAVVMTMTFTHVAKSDRWQAQLLVVSGLNADAHPGPIPPIGDLGPAIERWHAAGASVDMLTYTATVPTRAPTRFQ